MEAAIVIPSLEPNQHLLGLVTELQEKISTNEQDIKIIIVNDGSGYSYEPIFSELSEKNCIILKHAVNMGKGRALKTAFNYFLNNYPEGIGVVTADSDGQHTVDDIFSCIRNLYANPNSLILGTRQFDEKSIPLRSRFGNNLTKKVFKFLCGVDVNDTQTGLRGIPSTFMREILTMPGERFEYEMNMLIETKEKEVPIVQVPIETIYIADNESSHFNPILDSIRIYSVFLKFIVSSLASFVVDILLFSLFLSLFNLFATEKILIATVLARIGSSLFNFRSNQKLVFKAKGDTRKVAIKYFSLVIIQMLVSAGLVTLIASKISLTIPLIKIIVDFILFLISFQIQRNWIFK